MSWDFECLFTLKDGNSCPVLQLTSVSVESTGSEKVRGGTDLTCSTSLFLFLKLRPKVKPCLKHALKLQNAFETSHKHTCRTLCVLYIFFVYFLLKSRGCPASCRKHMTWFTSVVSKWQPPPQPPHLVLKPPLDPQVTSGTGWIQLELFASAVFTSALQQLSTHRHTHTRLRPWLRAHSQGGFPPNTRAGTREPNRHIQARLVALIVQTANSELVWKNCFITKIM